MITLCLMDGIFRCTLGNVIFCTTTSRSVSKTVHVVLDDDDDDADDDDAAAAAIAIPVQPVPQPNSNTMTDEWLL